MLRSEVSQTETPATAWHQKYLATLPSNRIAGLIVILLVAAVGVALALQGWKSRIPFVDLTPPIDNAAKLLDSGIIPQWGQANSLGSYAPPGSSWLLVPGLSLFSDPRLFEYGGGIILYLGTLVGIFLLARQFFSFRCAALAVILYGLSELGLYFAESLWPKGHPFFYIWTIYFITLWVKRKNPWYLAGAIITSMAGIYIHMEMAPVIFIIPIAWLLYRSPIHLIPVLVGVAVSLLLWSPYLMFEHDRNFYDVTTQLSQKQFWGDYKSSWCNKDIDFTLIRDAKRQLPSYYTSAVGHVMQNNLAIGLFGNFSRSLKVLGVPDILFGLTAASLAIILGATLVAAKPLSVLRGAWKKFPSRYVPEALEQGLIALLLLIPWGLLLYASRNATYLVETRFWWLWPAQIILLAALATDLALRMGVPHAIAWAGQALLVLLILANPLLIERTASWIENGWSGEDSYEKTAVDYIAGRIIGEGRREASIGYGISVARYMPIQNILDPRMKVGMELDLLFRFPYEICNKTRCAEGSSPNDEYRIVQTDASPALRYPFNFVDGLRRKIFDLPAEEKFETIKRFGPYLVQIRKDRLDPIRQRKIGPTVQGQTRPALPPISSGEGCR